MKLRLLPLCLTMLASTAWAEPDATITSGRFHIEVHAAQGLGAFTMSLRETTAQEPMEPVNEEQLHISCLLIPDLSAVSPAEVEAAAQIGGDRYCAAQFGDDHFAEIEGVALQAADDAYAARGTCNQAPL